MSTETTSTPKNGRRRKIQAILAGGIVLGIGAIVTLAAWNDSEFAQGEFEAGSFNLEGSVDGSSFADHGSIGEAAELDFSADNMAPGDTAFAPFSVRLDAATSYDATIASGSGLNLVQSSGDNAANMSYAVYEGVSSCSASGVGSASPIASSSSLTQGGVPLSTSIALGAGSGSSAGEAVDLCFAVTAAGQSSLVQGGEASATWRIQATSDDS